MSTITTTRTMEGFAPNGLTLPPALPMPIPAPVQTTGSRRKHKLIAAVASLVAAGLVAALVFHGYVAYLLAYPYVAPLASNPQEAIGLPYEDVVFPSSSGETTVSGWFVPAPADSFAPALMTASASNGTGTAVRAAVAGESHRTVVFSHGYGANREESWVPMYDLTKMLHGLGYNVLLFDYGYASKQYKAPATGGREESHQLLAAVQYAKSRGADDIVVWGFSMGGGTALQTALVTDEIDAMILDSLFLPSPETLFDNLNQYVPLPKYPSLPLIQTLIPLWSGTGFGSIPSEQVIGHRFSIPIFIVHGTNDDKASFHTAMAIADNQDPAISRSWIVENGRHELLFRSHPREYIQRTALFLSQVDQRLQAEREASGIALH